MGLFGNNDKEKEKKERKAQQDRIKKDEYIREQERIKAEADKRQKHKK